jgi:hypothetical protein
VHGAVLSKGIAIVSTSTHLGYTRISGDKDTSSSTRRQTVTDVHSMVRTQTELYDGKHVPFVSKISNEKFDFDFPRHVVR